MKIVVRIRLFLGVLACFLFLAGTGISHGHPVADKIISSVSAGSHETGNTAAFAERTNACSPEAENVSITISGNPVSLIKSQHTDHYAFSRAVAHILSGKCTTVLHNTPGLRIALSGPGIIFPFHYFW